MSAIVLIPKSFVTIRTDKSSIKILALSSDIACCNLTFFRQQSQCKAAVFCVTGNLRICVTKLTNVISFRTFPLFFKYSKFYKVVYILRITIKESVYLGGLDPLGRIVCKLFVEERSACRF